MFLRFPVIQHKRAVVEFLMLFLLLFTHVATRLGLCSLGYILNISFVIFFHVTKMCVEALLSHQVVLLLIAMHAIVIFPALTSLIALAIFDCVFYSVFASIRRWISGERTNALQSLSFADRQRPKRSFYSRLDAGFRRWNSKVPSRRHRDRCYATDIEVGF